MLNKILWLIGFWIFVMLLVLGFLFLVPDANAEGLCPADDRATPNDVVQSCSRIALQEIAGKTVTVIRAVTIGDANIGTSRVEVEVLVDGKHHVVTVNSLAFKKWSVWNNGFSYQEGVPVFPIPRGQNTPNGRLLTDEFYKTRLEFEDPGQYFVINREGVVGKRFAEINTMYVFEAAYTSTTADQEVIRIWKLVRNEDLVESFYYRDAAMELLGYESQGEESRWRQKPLSPQDVQILSSLVQLSPNSLLYWHLFNNLKEYDTADRTATVFATDTPVLCEKLNDFKRIATWQNPETGKVFFIDLYTIGRRIVIEGIKTEGKYIGILTHESAGKPQIVISDIKWYCP